MLLCAAETGTAFAMVSCLRRHHGSHVDIITADSNPSHLVTASLRSNLHLQAPAVSEPAFEAFVDHILAAEAITDYIPLHDLEFGVAERLRPRHAAAAIWSNPDYPRLTSDKIAAQDWLQTLGLPVPCRYDIEALPERGELFAKPKRGYASRGAGRRSVEMLKAMPAAGLEELMFQEVCTGPEITVDSFYDAETGACRAVARERIVVKDGICTAGRLFDDSTLAAWGRCIGEALGQRGTICFQVMHSARGNAIIDLNLRPGAGTAMGVAAGIDLLGAFTACRWRKPYDEMIARPLPPQGVYVTRQYAEFVMA